MTWYPDIPEEYRNQIVTVYVNDDWPEGISNGLFLPCSMCSQHTKLDYHVTDKFWLSVVPKSFRRDVICLPCLDQLAWSKQISIAEHLEFIQFTGIDKTLVLKPIQVYYYG